MTKKSITSLTPLSPSNPMVYKSNSVYNKSFSHVLSMPIPSLMSPTMPYSFNDLILPDNILNLANMIGIDPHEMQFLISQIENIDNEILVPRLKSLFSEMKLIYGNELQIHTTKINKRKQEFEKWKTTQTDIMKSSKSSGFSMKMFKANTIIDKLFDRYLDGVSVWNKKQLKKDKELRFLLSTTTLHFVKKGSFPFKKWYVEGLKPNLQNDFFLVDRICKL